MKTAIIVLLCLLWLGQSIPKLDFNQCRISNCNSEEINCISEESGCLNYFGIMRNWYNLH